MGRHRLELLRPRLPCCKAEYGKAQPGVSSPPRSWRALHEEKNFAVTGVGMSANSMRGHGACGCAKIPVTGIGSENALRCPERRRFETASGHEGA